MKLITYLILAVTMVSCITSETGKSNSQNENTEKKIPPILRFTRIFGENDERKPPILVLKDKDNKYSTAIGYSYLTMEFDISAIVPPAMVIKYVHCDVNWNETQNAFLQNSVNYRTTMVDWSSATFLDDYYSFRGRVKIPGPTVNLEFSGNWKAVIYDMDNENEPLGEVRFFVVKPQSVSRIMMYTDFYDVQYKVTNTGFTLETVVSSKEPFFDDRLHSVVYYRNNRWYEPFVATKDRRINNYQYLYNFSLRSMISGFSAYEKRFRLEGVPAENVYRVLNMTNTAVFPRSNYPVRFPLSDISRNGTYYDRDDDGVMITDFVSSSNDDYVYLEFVLDPESFTVNQDVFISGSFNNWKPDRSWIMFYDEKDRLYKCRNWVRRARHNYLYGTGVFNPETNSLEKFSFDFYEGNTAYSAHTFYAFVYYRQVELGGYDSIIGIASGNIFGDVIR